MLTPIAIAKQRIPPDDSGRDTKPGPAKSKNTAISHLSVILNPHKYTVNGTEAKSKVHDWGDKVDSGVPLRSTLAQVAPMPMVNVMESTLEWT